MSEQERRRLGFIAGIYFGSFLLWLRQQVAWVIGIGAGLVCAFCIRSDAGLMLAIAVFVVITILVDRIIEGD
jgi:hypothetical protein